MDIKLFAINASRQFGEKIAQSSSCIRLAELEERDFADGEHKIRSLESVRGQTVFVLQSLYSDREQSVNDKICRLLFLIAALKDAFAAKVIAVIPYFAYARKDRKTKTRDPVTMKYMARLLEASGADALLTMDIHNLAALQNAFSIPVEHLEARLLFAPYVADLLHDEEIVVVSPDAGGAKRAELFQELLGQLLQKEIGNAFLQKKRSKDEVTGGQLVVGNVKGRTAVIIDDIISSGSTLQLAADALNKQGAKRIVACATHGLFAGESNKNLSEPALERVIITNTILPFRLDKILQENKLIMLDAAPLFAEAILTIYQNGSMVELSREFPLRRTEKKDC